MSANLFSGFFSCQEWQWIYGKTPRFTVTFSTSIASNDIVSDEHLTFLKIKLSSSLPCFQ